MKKILILFVSIIFVSTNSFSQNEKLKTVFMYNFAKYISFPSKSGDFVIGIMGSPKLVAEMKKIAQKRKVGSRTIKVLSFSSSATIKKCNILYISNSKRSQLSNSLKKVSLLPVVVVSDSPGSIPKGAGLNFVISGGKQKFEVRKRNVEKNGIKINSALIKLGINK